MTLLYKTPRKEGNKFEGPCCINPLPRGEDPLQILETHAIFLNPSVPVVQSPRKEGTELW